MIEDHGHEEHHEDLPTNCAEGVIKCIASNINDHDHADHHEDHFHSNINTYVTYVLFSIGILFLLFFVLLSACPPFLRSRSTVKRRAPDPKLPTGDIREI